MAHNADKAVLYSRLNRLDWYAEKDENPILIRLQGEGEQDMDDDWRTNRLSLAEPFVFLQQKLTRKSSTSTWQGIDREIFSFFRAPFSLLKRERER